MRIFYALLMLCLIFINLAAEDNLYAKALALLNDNKPDEAVEIIQRYLKNNPLDSDAYFTLAMALNRLEKYTSAYDNLKKSLELNPSQASTFFALALTAEKLNKYTEAKNYWSKFLLLTKDNILIKTAQKHIKLMEQINE